MPDNRQTKALARLQQIKQLQAMAEQREALQAQAKVAEVERGIASLDARVAAEIAAFTDYADTPALGRWGDLIDSRREVLVQHTIMQQRLADALAQKAAEANLMAEQHAELLRHLRAKLTAERQRATDRDTWEAFTARLAWQADGGWLANRL